VGGCSDRGSAKNALHPLERPYSCADSFLLIKTQDMCIYHTVYGVAITDQRHDSLRHKGLFTSGVAGDKRLCAACGGFFLPADN
jgi:hypothetical protein